MKELSIEQKAKAYDEALERTKQIIMDYDYDENDNVFMEIFPELKESNENIKYSLMQYLWDLWHKDSIPPRPDITTCDKWIDWLEKQGKKEPKKTSIWNHWKEGICGNGEGKLIYLIKDGDDYSLSSSLAYECDYIELSALDELMLPKKQGEQKPAKWSEEDKVKINRIVACLENLNVADNDILLKDVDWLKSLKYRVQPKQEWGEEDEKIFDEIVGDLEALELKTTSEKYSAMYKKELSWLKSLKPRNMWKPSDEQMDALNCARWNAPFNIEIFDSLYNDLKKLTE